MKKAVKKKKTAKKATKKSVKKPAKKKVIKKTVKNVRKPKKPKVEVIIRKKVLGEAPQEHHFMLRDGKKIKTVYQLIDELEMMNEDLFKHHVNEHRNDFANWIEHVFDERSLADELRYIEDRIDTQRAILKELVRTLTKEVHKK